jgi:hypothetical protein
VSTIKSMNNNKPKKSWNKLLKIRKTKLTKSPVIKSSLLAANMASTKGVQTLDWAASLAYEYLYLIKREPNLSEQQENRIMELYHKAALSPHLNVLMQEIDSFVYGEVTEKEKIQIQNNFGVAE